MKDWHPDYIKQLESLKDLTLNEVMALDWWISREYLKRTNQIMRHTKGYMTTCSSMARFIQEQEGGSMILAQHPT